MMMRALLVVLGFTLSVSAQPMALPYTTCSQSDTWTRPSARVQAKIWNDNRYAPAARTSYEWTHDFVLTEPDSASLPYHSANLSGLWTAGPRASCPRRDGEHGSWIEMWALLHRVRMVALEDHVITVYADQREAGFEIVQFRRPAFVDGERLRLRVVGEDGAVLQEWTETSPSLLTPVR
jgi:hypothetical protein